MRISKAIELYRKSVNDAIYHKKPFTMIRCGDGCSCVRGMVFDRIILDGMFLTADKYTFKLSVNLANKLESEFLPIIQPHRVGQTWEDRTVKEPI